MSESLTEIVAGIDAYDGTEVEHQRRVLEWIGSGAPLYRIRKPDDPPQHLVVYFVVVDPDQDALLLVDHRKAGLRLPTGGHVEPGEALWAAVARECAEEIGIPATPTAWLGERPLFITVTPTRDPHGDLGIHTDVTTWHLVAAPRASVVSFDRSEFAAVHWLSPAQILETPIAHLDPHMHRFVRKYLSARDALQWTS